MKMTDLFYEIAKALYCSEKERQYFFNSMKNTYEIQSSNTIEINGQFYVGMDKSEKDIKDNLDIKDNKIYVYDETGHSGDWRIKELNSFDEVEEYILSPGMFLNMFCSRIVVISNRRYHPFRVYEEVNTNKVYLDCGDECEHIENVYIEWL